MISKFMMSNETIEMLVAGAIADIEKAHEQNKNESLIRAPYFLFPSEIRPDRMWLVQTHYNAFADMIYIGIDYYVARSAGFRCIYQANESAPYGTDRVKCVADWTKFAIETFNSRVIEYVGEVFECYSGIIDLNKLGIAEGRIEKIEEG